MSQAVALQALLLVRGDIDQHPAAGQAAQFPTAGPPEGITGRVRHRPRGGVWQTSFGAESSVSDILAGLAGVAWPLAARGGVLALVASRRGTRAVSSAGERFPDTEEVTGSNPVRPTRLTWTFGPVGPSGPGFWPYGL